MFQPSDELVHPIKLKPEWRTAYQKRRYLEHATNEELEQRQKDLVHNVYAFDELGRMTITGREEVWDRLLAHVLAEAEMRGMKIAQSIKLPDYLKQKRAAEIWSSHLKPTKPFLVKYGKRVHLEPMIYSGAFRLSPASKYRNSLNPAIRDTELEFIEEMYDSTIEAPENADYSIPQERWQPLPVIGTVKWHLVSESDYFTACFSNTYAYRLFEDYEADSCLVIREPERLIEKLQESFSQMFPGWQFSRDNVSYRDPFHPTLDDSIVYAKHFRYAYQREFRLAWQPPVKIPVLEYLDLSLGSLADFCDLLTL